MNIQNPNDSKLAASINRAISPASSTTAGASDSASSGTWLKLHKDCRVQWNQLIYVGWDVGTGRIIIILSVGQVLALHCENENKNEIVALLPLGKDVEFLVKSVELIT